MTTINNNKMNEMTTIVNNIMNNLDAWTRITLKNGLKHMERTGFVTFAVEIPMDKLSVPAFQRDKKNNIINKILRNFDPNLVEYLVVNFNPETLNFEILDGQHTAIALKHLGYTSVMCKVFIGLTDVEKATVFATQYKKKTRLSAIDEYNTYKWAGMEPAKTIENVSKEFKITVGGTYGSLRCVTSIRKLNQIVKKYGADGLRFCYKVIEDANWTEDSKAYVEAILNMTYFAYPLCHNDKAKYDTLISMLNQFTPTEFIDYVRFEYREISAKHPENGVRYIIEDVLR